MKRFKMTAVRMTNSLPFQITPHLEQQVWSDNSYLPINQYTPQQRKLLSVKETPRVAWRNGVPVIPATKFKGALRHQLAEFQTRGMSNLPLKMFNYLALGGVKAKGVSDMVNSPVNRMNERQRYPLVSLFGAADPMFIRGAIRAFPDLVPTSIFTLDEVPIIRTDPVVQDEASIRVNPREIDENILLESESSGSMKKAKADLNAANTARAKAKKNQLPGEIQKAEEAVDKAMKAVYLAEKERLVQTGQLHSFHVIPAGQTFAHEFRLEAEDHEIGLLLLGLQEFGFGGGMLGGQAARGCGGHLDFIYELSVEEDRSWRTLGQIANDEVDASLMSFVRSYRDQEDVFLANIDSSYKSMTLPPPRTKIPKSKQTA